MIEWIKLRNFQKHKLWKLELDKGVTTLVGPTDAGKSAVIRALRWLCLNKPNGVRVRRRGAKTVSVEVGVDGHVVKRTRGKENTYSINGKRFKAFGNNVPEPVSDLLRIIEANFQRQHDAPFWFSSSPAQVSKELNKIVNLGKIDSSLKNVSAIVRNGNQEVSILERQDKELEKERASLAWVKKASLTLSKIESIQAKIDDLDSTIENLDGHIRQVIQVQVEAGPLKKLATDAERLAGILFELTGVAQSSIHLQKLIARIETAGNLQWVNKCNIQPVTDALQRLELNAAFMNSLSDHITMIERAEKHYQEASDELERFKSKHKKRIGKRCPLCKQRIK